MSVDIDLNIKNQQEKNSVCMVTICLYEHDYIAQWIEHHIRIGFSQFIILIDDMLPDGIGPQKDYPIPEEFKDIVTVIRVTEQMVLENPDWKRESYDVYRNRSKHNDGVKDSHLIHTCINDYGVVKGNIKTEWVTVIAPDQYICLEHHDSIVEFFGSIREDCFQVFFPWVALPSNPHFHVPCNFFKQVAQSSITGFEMMHTNGACRVKDMWRMDNNSHRILPRSGTALTYLAGCCEYQTINYHHDNIISKYWHPSNDKFHGPDIKSDLSKIPVYSVHQYIRGFQDTIMKNIFWRVSLSDPKFQDNIIMKIADVVKQNEVSVATSTDSALSCHGRYAGLRGAITALSTNHPPQLCLDMKCKDMKYNNPKLHRRVYIFKFKEAWSYQRRILKMGWVYDTSVDNFRRSKKFAKNMVSGRIETNNKI